MAHHDNIQAQISESWNIYLDSLKESIDMLERALGEAAEMRGMCTGEWCDATEHVIDEISNSLFAISEPRWTSDKDHKKLRMLKRRVHDLYAMYRNVSGA